MRPDRFSRILVEHPPFLPFETAQRGAGSPWSDFDRWPARWIAPSKGPAAPFVALFRLRFALSHARRLRLHVSAHERYELYFERADRRCLVGRGPTRAPAGFRHFETFEAELEAGEGQLLARVIQLGARAPWAQVAGDCGFLCAAQDEDLWDMLNSGRAPWQTRLLDGLSWRSPRELAGCDMGCGALEVVGGEALAFDRWSKGAWLPAEAGKAGNNGFTLYARPDVPLLRPAPLPAPFDAPWRRLELVGADADVRTAPVAPSIPAIADEWAGFWAGAEHAANLVVPPRTRRRFWLRSAEYVCAYPTLRGRGGEGGRVRLAWAESLRDNDGRPVRRPPFEGAQLPGIWDELHPEGGAWTWTPTWWRCGLFLRLDIETGETPLYLDAFELRETRYPFEPKVELSATDPALRPVLTKCVRALQMCAHETYMDCPYYEQLQYLGDTRVQMLCSYAVFGDDRLARAALWTYAMAARNPTGWMPSSAPSYGGQRIGTFTLWWIEMLHDFWRWRGDAEFVRALLPTARSTAELWLQQLGADDRVVLPPGWNFLDAAGELTDLRGPVHGAIQWHVAGVLRQLAVLETAVGETELAARAARQARRVAAAAEGFWCATRGLVADDLEAQRFSEQTNVLALRSGLLDATRGERIAAALFDREDIALTRSSIYFMHYAFEAASAYGRRTWMEARLKPWRDLDAAGLTTTPELWDATRSECHAWGAHPLLHFAPVLLARSAATPVSFVVK